MSANPPNHFDEVAKEARVRIKELTSEVIRNLHFEANQLPETEVHDIDELRANITLAYRHLEDAAMRIGKAIQARDGGISVYDK